MKSAALAFWVVSLVALLGGCSSPKPLYPIGIFGVPASEMRSVREAGFNFVVGPADETYLDHAGAADLGVYATFASGWSHEVPFAAEQSREIRMLDRHPALKAWYLVDEPDLNLIPPAQVARLNREVKAAGARKPTALCLFQGYETLNYGKLTDMLLVDRYPVPWLPLANFGQHVGMGRLGLGKGRKLIAVIQAFDWNYYPELLPGEKDLRPPTHEEIRCMTYEALARGANGIAFYQYEGRWKIRDHPEVWNALREVIGEVTNRAPLFLAEPVWWAKDHDFAPREHRFNPALESSVTSVLLRVRDGNSLVPSGDYILAVNNTPRQLRYGFTLPKPAPRSTTDSSANATSVTGIPVLGEDRKVSPEDGWVWDQFDSFAVHVYGPL